MAKIKINKLPKGYKLEKGKVVEDQVMKDGGMLNTGDQANYGLVTTPQEYYSNTNFNNTDDKSVRYSLSSVPRDRANIEAEGGETVLTDLTNDGQFGLYNITGPRHTSGGVPMFLPEQSFIYSDTSKMKFTKDELAEFGINTKKKMTPAKLSKKYQLNDYYGHLESPYADKIQAITSELMLKKNMMNLSKVAFVQESKKKFEDGVPLAAHPYLVQQGIDPIEFTSKMEAITKEEAEMRMIASLPPEQQQQMMMLQQMMAQVDQQAAQGEQPMQQPMQQEMMMQEQPMARYGTEMLQKAQVGIEPKPNIAYDQSMQDRYTNDWGITFNDIGIGSTSYDNTQPYNEGGLFADAASNMDGFKKAYADIYPNYQALIESLPKYGKSKNPEVLKFQEWFTNTHIPEQVAAMKIERERVGKTFTDEDAAKAIKQLQKDYAPKQDSLMGVQTSSRRPFTFVDGEIVTEEESDNSIINKDIPQVIPQEYTPPRAEWWKQDQNNLTALGLIDDNLYLPFQPDIERSSFSPSFDDWRGAVNANNADARAIAQELGAAGGPQAIANSDLAGQVMKANARAIGTTNSKNVAIDNQARAMNAQMDAQFNQLEGNRKVKLYDDTQKVLQANDNFKNWRIAQQAALQNAALTNRANTFNLNTTYDNYAVDPRTGGMVGITNSRGLERTGLPADRQEQLLESWGKLQREAGKDNKVSMEDAIKFMNYASPQGGSPYQTNAQAELIRRGQPQVPFVQNKNGNEIKRMAVPFYTGKMGR